MYFLKRNIILLLFIAMVIHTKAEAQPPCKLPTIHFADVQNRFDSTKSSVGVVRKLNHIKDLLVLTKNIVNPIPSFEKECKNCLYLESSLLQSDPNLLDSQSINTFSYTLKILLYNNKNRTIYEKDFIYRNLSNLMKNKAFPNLLSASYNDVFSLFEEVNNSNNIGSLTRKDKFIPIFLEDSRKSVRVTPTCISEIFSKLNSITPKTMGNVVKIKYSLKTVNNGYVVAFKVVVSQDGLISEKNGKAFFSEIFITTSEIVNDDYSFFYGKLMLYRHKFITANNEY
ncbi:hypothetical protein [uncultured Fibrella sp.]|uniref:hypothetical protein n=1 Tax=uncultured Fibrella sp. TaxID=1284596 RepID=UPI0035CB9E07